MHILSCTMYTRNITGYDPISIWAKTLDTPSNRSSCILEQFIAVWAPLASHKKYCFNSSLKESFLRNLMMEMVIV